MEDIFESSRVDEFPQIFDAFDNPLELYGLPEENLQLRNFERLPQSLIALLPQYEELGRRSVGGRLRFQTDAESFLVQYQLATETLDIAMALPAAAGMDVYDGIAWESKYLGYIAPSEYGYKNKVISKIFTKSKGLSQVTINLPRNERLSKLTVSFPDGARVEAPKPYQKDGQIVFYGSSITEGGCAPRPGCAYTSLVCRWLDVDYMNLGFSGGARGDLECASYIGQLNTTRVFVMDYDHNAPSADFLEKTHWPFYERVRSLKPNLPIVLMSRPDFYENKEEDIRRLHVIEKTFKKAKSKGDNLVYFLDGSTIFCANSKEESTIDGCHPNALGFFQMAQKLMPILESILEDDLP